MTNRVLLNLQNVFTCLGGQSEPPAPPGGPPLNQPGGTLSSCLGSPDRPRGLGFESCPTVTDVIASEIKGQGEVSPWNALSRIGRVVLDEQLILSRGLLRDDVRWIENEDSLCLTGKTVPGTGPKRIQKSAVASLLREEIVKEVLESACLSEGLKERMWEAAVNYACLLYKGEFSAMNMRLLSAVVKLAAEDESICRRNEKFSGRSREEAILELRRLLYAALLSATGERGELRKWAERCRVEKPVVPWLTSMSREVLADERQCRAVWRLLRCCGIYEILFTKGRAGEILGWNIQKGHPMEIQKLRRVDGLGVEDTFRLVEKLGAPKGALSRLVSLGVDGPLKSRELLELAGRLPALQRVKANPLTVELVADKEARLTPRKKGVSVLSKTGRVELYFTSRGVSAGDIRRLREFMPLRLKVTGYLENLLQIAGNQASGLKMLRSLQELEFDFQKIHGFPNLLGLGTLFGNCTDLKRVKVTGLTEPGIGMLDAMVPRGQGPCKSMRTISLAPHTPEILYDPRLLQVLGACKFLQELKICSSVSATRPRGASDASIVRCLATAQWAFFFKQKRLEALSIECARPEDEESCAQILFAAIGGAGIRTLEVDESKREGAPLLGRFAKLLQEHCDKSEAPAGTGNTGDAERTASEDSEDTETDSLLGGITQSVGILNWHIRSLSDLPSWSEIKSLKLLANLKRLSILVNGVPVGDCLKQLLRDGSRAKWDAICQSQLRRSSTLVVTPETIAEATEAIGSPGPLASLALAIADGLDPKKADALYRAIGERDDLKILRLEVPGPEWLGLHRRRLLFNGAGGLGRVLESLELSLPANSADAAANALREIELRGVKVQVTARGEKASRTRRRTTVISVAGKAVGPAASASGRLAAVGAPEQVMNAHGQLEVPGEQRESGVDEATVEIWDSARRQKEGESEGGSMQPEVASSGAEIETTEDEGGVTTDSEEGRETTDSEELLRKTPTQWSPVLRKKGMTE